MEVKGGLGGLDSRIRISGSTGFRGLEPPIRLPGWRLRSGKHGLWVSLVSWFARDFRGGKWEVGSKTGFERPEP